MDKLRLCSFLSSSFFCIVVAKLTKGGWNEKKRTELQEMKIIHNEFPKLAEIPKDILTLFISCLEFEIRDYYKDKIDKPKVPP